MKILYLHGLDSVLQDDRRQEMEKYGEVHGPTLDYKNTPGLYKKLAETYHNVDSIIGSSAGGLVTYYLAQTLKKPCLLFNPALPFRSEMPMPTAFNNVHDQFMQVVIGLQDDVVNPQQTIALLQSDIAPRQKVEIHLINQMEHSYPISIFAKELAYFIETITQK